MWKISAILKTELKDSFNLKIPQGIKNKLALTLKNCPPPKTYIVI